MQEVATHCIGLALADWECSSNLLASGILHSVLLGVSVPKNVHALLENCFER